MGLELGSLITSIVWIELIFLYIFVAVIKDNKKYSVVEKESSTLAVDCNPQNESSAGVEQCGFEGPHDGGARVIEDSVFKLFNDSGGRVRKRSADCITG